MVVNLGPTPQQTVDAVELLLACHRRIRTFLGFAEQLAKTPEVTGPEAVDVCERVLRYFGEAFPLHHRDEDESVLPRLRGKHRALDEALDRMAEDHGAIGLALASLLAVLKEVKADPAEPSHRQRLLTVTLLLEKIIGPHLAMEEQTVLPAIRTHLDAATQAALLSEIRARRTGGAS